MTSYSEFLASNPMPSPWLVCGPVDSGRFCEEPKHARKAGLDWQEPIINNYTKTRKPVKRTAAEKAATKQKQINTYMALRVKRFSRMAGKGRMCIADIARLISSNEKSTRLMLYKLVESKHCVMFGEGTDKRCSEFMWVAK